MRIIADSIRGDRAMRLPYARNRRGGWTLIELLVVLAIFTTLMSFIVAAAMMVYDAGKKATAVADLRELDMAITKFKADFKIKDPIPSCVRLHENMGDY